ncbi:MAG: class I SAM-dependent methyltransferase [Patescibacteria group bacterium]
MVWYLIYILTIVGIFWFLIWFIIKFISLSYSAYKGAPYVPTKMREVHTILSLTDLKKGQRFVDIGCGDGRVVREAVIRYGVEGYGVDINPILIQQARKKAHGVTNLLFDVQDVRTMSFSGYDIIYIYMLPQFIQLIQDRLFTEARDDCLIISHWFKLQGWEDYLEKSPHTGQFYTYYYRLPPQRDRTVSQKSISNHNHSLEKK